MSCARVAVLVAALTILVPSVADACSCARGGSVADSFRIADVVFDGEVVAVDMPVQLDHPFITYLVPDKWLNWEKRVSFKVRGAYKGLTTQTVVVRTGLGGGDCGIGFSEGDRWLVYAYGDPPSTGICSRSRAFPGASADLAELGSARTDLVPIRRRGLWWLVAIAAMLLIVAAVLWRWWRKDEAIVPVR